MYICWHLRYVQSAVRLNAKKCGAPVNTIEKTYEYISTIMEAEVLTKDQG